MNKVLEVIGALTLGSALVGGGMLYGGALGVIAATDRKTAEETFYGKVLVRSIENRRKLKRPHISYANLAPIRKAEKKINEKLTDHVPLGEVLEELQEAERKVNEKLKDRSTVSAYEIANEVRKELGMDRTDKWPFFSMTEEEQR